jgi:hypothetical protein
MACPRGDRNRNARLDRLRALVPVSNAIVGIDLADCKQMVVVTDHDSKVLARKTYRCRVWDLGAALDWACERAACDARTRDYVRAQHAKGRTHRRSCDCSNAPSPAKSSSHSPAASLHPNSATCDRPRTSPSPPPREP